MSKLPDAITRREVVYGRPKRPVDYLALGQAYHEAGRPTDALDAALRIEGDQAGHDALVAAVRERVTTELGDIPEEPTLKVPVGVQDLFQQTVGMDVTGPDGEWDEAFVMGYPDSATFMAMVRNEEYVRDVVPHRTAAVADSRLIRFRG